MLARCTSSSFEALSNPCKITGWNYPTGDKEQLSVLSLVCRPSTEKNVQDVSETSQVKASRKRSRSSDVQDVVDDISTKLGEVAAAISKMDDSRLDVTRFYEEVMASEGYEEEFLGDALDYLVQNETLAKAFLAKN